MNFEHRRAVGGKWKEMGKFQFNLLVERGLKPHHFLLDIGCGALRGGIHFIDYLNLGRYFGVEKEQWILEAGIREELSQDLKKKQPKLYSFSDFRFQNIIDREFDFLLAQSVFTHLKPNSTRKCIAEASKVMREDSKFLATFWPGKLEQGVTHPFRADEFEVCTYPVDWFKTTGKEYNLKVEHEEIDHPYDQELLIFRKNAN